MSGATCCFSEIPRESGEYPAGESYCGASRCPHLPLQLQELVLQTFLCSGMEGLARPQAEPIPRTYEGCKAGRWGFKQTAAVKAVLASFPTDSVGFMVLSFRL